MVRALGTAVLGFILLNAFAARADEGASAAGQTGDPATMVELKERLMYFRVDNAGGGLLAGMSVFQNGKRLDLGLLGGNVDTYFKDAPEALQTAHFYRERAVLGLSLATVGTAVLLADLAVILVFVSEGTLHNHEGLNVGLLLGGLAVAIPGNLVLSSAQTKLSEAVDQFNAHLLNEHLPPEQRIDYRLFFSQNGAGAELRFHF